MIREKWLNGWCRMGSEVLVGTSVHCAGCGKDHGTACVAFDGSPLPDKSPDWPFEESTCPLCEMRDRLWSNQPTVPPNIMKAYRLGLSKAPLISQE